MKTKRETQTILSIVRYSYLSRILSSIVSFRNTHSTLTDPPTTSPCNQIPKTLIILSMAVENSLLNSANTLFGADIIQRNEENPLEQRNLRKAACRRKRRHSLSPPLFLSLGIEEALSHAWRLRSPRCWLASPVESEDEGAGRYGGRVVTNCPSPSPPESPLINADCLTLGPSSSVLTILLPRHREEDPLAC